MPVGERQSGCLVHDLMESGGRQQAMLPSRLLPSFFLPNGQPYRYTAGAAGVELLEFRAGGGVSGAPGLKLDETSLDSLQKIIDGSYENDHLWEAPERIGDTALRQARIDGRLD